MSGLLRTILHLAHGVGGRERAAGGTRCGRSARLQPAARGASAVPQDERIATESHRDRRWRWLSGNERGLGGGAEWRVGDTPRQGEGVRKLSHLPSPKHRATFLCATIHAAFSH